MLVQLQKMDVGGKMYFNVVLCRRPVDGTVVKCNGLRSTSFQQCRFSVNCRTSGALEKSHFIFFFIILCKYSNPWIIYFLFFYSSLGKYRDFLNKDKWCKFLTFRKRQPRNICRTNSIHSQVPRELSRCVKTTTFVMILLTMCLLKEEVLIKQNSSQL